MEINIPYYEDNTRVSASLLKSFIKSPSKAKAMLDGEGMKSTPGMEDGTMTHMYFLQNEEFRKTYKILDFEAPSSAQQKKFCEDYVNSKLDKPILRASEAFELNYSTSGKPKEYSATKGLEMALKLKPYIKYLRSKDGDKKLITWAKMSGLKITKENIILHKLANKLLLTNEDSPDIEALNEFHINWEYSKDDLKIACKSLIDRIIIDYKNKKIKLIDIKTTSDISGFKKSFEEYEYALQMAFYCAAIYWYIKNEKKLDPDEFDLEVLIVALENNGKYQCRVFKVSEQALLEKKQQIEQIIPELYWHMSKDLWEQTREYYEGDGAESL